MTGILYLLVRERIGHPLQTAGRPRVGRDPRGHHPRRHRRRRVGAPVQQGRGGQKHSATLGIHCFLKIGCSSYRQHGQSSSTFPSRFVSYIPQHLNSKGSFVDFFIFFPFNRQVAHIKLAKADAVDAFQGLRNELTNQISKDFRLTERRSKREVTAECPPNRAGCRGRGSRSCC